MKGSQEEKLKVLFLLFERQPGSIQITREDIKNHVTKVILSMMSVSFDDPEVELLKS